MVVSLSHLAKRRRAYDKLLRLSQHILHRGMDDCRRVFASEGSDGVHGHAELNRPVNLSRTAGIFCEPCW